MRRACSKRAAAPYDGCAFACRLSSVPEHMVEKGAEHRIGHAQMEALGMSSHSTVTSSDT